jgi:hypothetical protein
MRQEFLSEGVELRDADAHCLDQDEVQDDEDEPRNNNYTKCTRQLVSNEAR